MDTSLPSRIKAFNANRLPQTLPLKYKAMAEGPFRFFRGTCHLFYEDLLKNYPFPASPRSWICGDLHIENFGSYKGPNRLAYFDLNDFDEAVQAPVLYEIARLLVSIEVATAQSGFSRKEKKDLLHHLLHYYKLVLIRNKPGNVEEETATGLIKKSIKQVAGRTEAELLAKRTNGKVSNAKFIIGPRLLALPKPEKQELAAAFNQWFSEHHHKGYRVTDLGYRVAGTGSIGVRRYACLLENEKKPKRKLIIDIKQALPSCILNYADLQQPSWNNEAARVIGVQEIMQHVSPAFLSTFLYKEVWYVVKELQPTADRISIDNTVKQFSSTQQYLVDLGMLAAAAELRGTGRKKAATADELKEFAIDDNWSSPLLEWCAEYASQVKKDYKTFYAAWKDGYFNSKAI